MKKTRIVLIVAAALAAAFPLHARGSGEVSPGAAARSRDALLLKDTGVLLANYSMRESQMNGRPIRTYTAKPLSPEDTRFVEVKVAAMVDARKDGMPDMKGIVSALGSPTTITISDSRNTYVNFSYDAIVTFFFMEGAPQLMEIRFENPGTYRIRQSVGVGSTREDVVAMFGLPAKTEEYPRFQLAYYPSDGVRFFYSAGKVASMYFFAPGSSVITRDPSSGSSPAASQPSETAPFADVRNKNLKAVSGMDLALIRTFWLNRTTLFDSTAEAIAQRVIGDGKNPGLGVRALHAQGITGAGVSVAIIDQNLAGTDHPEYKGKVVMYKDVGTGASPSAGSMHGPAVLSLLVGESAGTAPGARVYYAAAPSWLADAHYYAEALKWIIGENARLPAGKKIRVVSVSAAPSGPGSPFTKNNAEWDDAVTKAVKAEILVLDCTMTYGRIGPCYYDPEDPESMEKAAPGWPSQPPASVQGRLLAPTSYRATAEEYASGSPGWQYTGQGGLSWGIPWASGVLAMGWQVNPSLGPDQIMKLLDDSAYVGKDGAKIIDPGAFIEAVKKSKG